MTIRSMTVLIRDFVIDPAKFAETYRHPVLLWEPPAHQRGIVHTTDATGKMLSFERSEPVAVEILKSAAQNPFPFGVTIGHAENNDIVLRHDQVSRFHAFIQEASGHWLLFDANSRNGTFLDGRRLESTKPVRLPAAGKIGFGQLQISFLEPAQLAAHIGSLVSPRAVAGKTA